MRVNMNKTKVMISGEWQKVMQKAVRWPCGVVCKLPVLRHLALDDPGVIKCKVAENRHGSSIIVDVSVGR